MNSVLFSLLISIVVLLTINFMSYKFVPAETSVIHRKLKWKYGTNISETELRTVTILLNSSSETSENVGFETNTQAVNIFNCSNNVVIYFPSLFEEF